MKSKAWQKFDTGDPITDDELLDMLFEIGSGISFLKARGEHGGVLKSALLDQIRLQDYARGRGLKS